MVKKQKHKTHVKTPDTFQDDSPLDCGYGHTTDGQTNAYVKMVF